MFTVSTIIHSFYLMMQMSNFSLNICISFLLVLKTKQKHSSLIFSFSQISRGGICKILVLVVIEKGKNGEKVITI